MKAREIGEVIGYGLRIAIVVATSLTWGYIVFHFITKYWRPMPNPGSEKPLRKVTLNLFEDDCRTLERMLGQGWTTYIREAVAANCAKLHSHKRTVGDLDV